MPTDWVDYDYAIVRIVPQVHCCAFVNAGVILHARTARFLGARVHLDRNHLVALDASIDVDLIERYLNAYRQVCDGADGSGPIGQLPRSERFHWLTAPRSTVLQTSPVHGGRTRDPERTLDRLFTQYVAPSDG
jgi:hypothetical protein